MIKNIKTHGKLLGQSPMRLKYGCCYIKFKHNNYSISIEKNQLVNHPGGAI